MIDIHITSEEVRSKIKNETAIDVMTALTSAVFHICKGNNFPIRSIAAALVEADEVFKNKED